MGADDADDRSAGLAADRKAAREHVDVVTVLVAEAELGLVGRSLAARDAVVRPSRARLVVGMQPDVPRR